MKSHISYNQILNALFFMILVFQDAGTFSFLPLNLFQILELIMFFIICTTQKKLKLNRIFLLLFFYITLVTICQPFDIESIKTLAFLFISLTTIYLYLQMTDIQTVANIIYSAAVLLSLYGIAQELAYILNIPEIYDISRYGFALNGTYSATSGLMRAMSLYAEPSHTSSILGLGFLIGLIGKNGTIENVRLWKSIVILIFAVLTQSTIVYITILMAVICFVFIYQERLSNKVKGFVLALLVFVVLLITQQELIANVIGRLSQFETLQTDTGNDLSALAIVTNLDIALEKMKDGYLFGTGIDSHRLYYDKYIGQLYTNLYMYLNSSDCASMYIRIFSEFGIIGIIGFVGALINKVAKGVKNANKTVLISAAMFSVAIMRDGNYMRCLSQVLFIMIFFKKYKSNHTINHLQHMRTKHYDLIEANNKEN